MTEQEIISKNIMKENDKDIEEDILELKGYIESKTLTVISWIGIILTLGFLRILFFWYPVIYLKATHSKTTLAFATKLLVTDIFEKKRTLLICHIKVVDVEGYQKSYIDKELNESNRFIDEQFEAIFDNDTAVYFQDGTYKILNGNIRLTHIKKLPYIWDDETHKFRKITGVGMGLTHQDLHHYSQYSEQQRHIMNLVYGDNEIKVPNTPFLVIVIRETFTPFYMLQFVNTFLWGITGDWTYTGVIGVFTIAVILLTSLQTKWNQIQLKRAIASQVEYFSVVSGNDMVPVTSNQIVPGDRVLLPATGCRVPCDGVVLSGTCIVNESMLTGESVVQTKTPISSNNEDYIEKESGNNSMYTGTKMIRSQSSEPVQLLVTRTGFSTAQGSIVRSILYPRPLDFDLENSVFKFALFIFILSLIGAVINDIVQISQKESAGRIIINTIKTSIMLIPAIMPIISASKIVGMRKIMKHKIYCINSAAFNLAGTATVTCFDKTGTLTEDGLDLYSVIPSKSAHFSEPISGNDPPRPFEDKEITKCMACCHSVMNIDGEKVGDPIDIKILEWTKWDLIMLEGFDEQKYPTVFPKDNPKYSMQILHQCQFSSNLQRMSVVVQCSDESLLHLYCKGSPEIISSLSFPDTVPTNFTNLLEMYTSRGFRVLALGKRILSTNSLDKIRRTTREELENQLEFVGLIAFENKLKSATIPTIDELNKANYKIIMITGDHLQTAECVAKESQIINLNQTVIELDEKNGQIKCTVTKSNSKMAIGYSLAENGKVEDDYVFSINGKAWEILKENYRHILPKILVKSAVFARMSSDQKKEVIRELGSLGYRVVMCGDGANDCGALRAADVGISLSTTEASAAASFTSHIEDISCVIHVLKYGRCSLATSVSFFKYMILSSILMTIVERFMQSMNSDLTDGDMTYLVTVTNINFAIWFPRSDVYTGPLPSHLPINSVISFSPIFSMVLNVIINFCFQVGIFFLIKQFWWYKAPSGEISYENYAMFCTVAFQLIILAVSQSPGLRDPFRQPVYRNFFLTAAVIIVFIMDMIIAINPPKLFTEWLQMTPPPSCDFPLTMLGLLACNFIICMILEKILVEKIIYEKCKRYPYLIKTKTKQKYLEIQEEVKNYNWVLQSFQQGTSKF